MERLERLQARIASLEELRDLFQALRALAASHVQEAQGALSGIRKYVGVIEEAIAEGAALLGGTGEWSGPLDAPKAGVLIVVCAEHGFAGAYNEHLLERAEAQRKEAQELVVIGQRGAAIARERGIGFKFNFPMATHVGGVLSVSRRVAAHLAAFPTADIVFGSYLRGGNYEVESRPILPLAPSLFSLSKRVSPPLHHLAPEALLQQLASEYLFAEITRAVMEAMASENAARLRVMESADHNIAEKLEGLRRKENTLRQEAITSELLELVTGSQAVLARRAR